MTATRRKYQFKDRAEAETAWKQEKDQAWLAEFVLGVLLHPAEGEVTWHRGTFYDVARVCKDRSDGGAVVIVWKPQALNPKSAQRPSTTVYGIDRACEMNKSVRYTTPHDPESLEYRELLGRAVADWAWTA
jgi:hypothetical protein